MTPRRVGVEEELLLTDVRTGDLRPSACEVLAACRARSSTSDGPACDAQIKHEFFLSQVEVATGPHARLGAVREELTESRALVAAVGAQIGVAPLAVPGPVLPVDAEQAEGLSPGGRYAAIRRHYAELARQSLMCAMHVHVEVTDEQEGVAVIDRLRPWLPVLVAITANSPYWRGDDVGYDSWRSRLWNMWPTGGPAELFGDPATYHGVVDDMVGRGTALDEAMVNFDVRLSRRYPTVEFRVADVCTDLDDTMVMAALSRTLVTHVADQWRAGAPAETWRVDELRAAAWRAARFGLGGTLVSPVSRELVEAHTVVRQLVTLLAASLEEAGDAELVARGVDALEARGNGAARQRMAFARTGGLPGVVADLRARTLES